MTQARSTIPSAQGAPAPATAAPAPPVPNVVTPQQLSSRDIEALRERASVLSSQLRNVSDRRHQVQNALRSATTPADRAGLEQRLSYLDGRITRIEAEIDQNSSQLASLSAVRTSAGIASRPDREPGFRVNNNNSTPIAIVFILFVMSPMAIAFARRLWKRTTADSAKPHPENTERLTRMEQAIDAIAIEMERVSEGQRFVTRLLAEGRAPSQLGSAQPGAESAQQAGERVGVSR